MKGNSQLYKGALNTILLQLLKENGKMYGYEITRKVKELTSNNINLTEGALYPALHKMEAEGLLQASVENNENRPRKYYTLTKKGRSETALKIEAFSEFIAQMQLLLNLKPTLK